MNFSTCIFGVRIPIVENGYLNAIEECTAYEEFLLNSLVHFCNTGKFLTEDYVNTVSS